MTRKEVVKAFMKNCILPIVIMGFLYLIFRTACIEGETVNYLLLWLLCGLPFGLHRMCLWIIPGGRSFGGSIAVFALNFLIGAIIGGFVLLWRLAVAIWYIPLTVYRIIIAE